MIYTRNVFYFLSYQLVQFFTNQNSYLYNQAYMYGYCCIVNLNSILQKVIHKMHKFLQSDHLLLSLGRCYKLICITYQIFNYPNLLTLSYLCSIQYIFKQDHSQIGFYLCIVIVFLINAKYLSIIYSDRPLYFSLLIFSILILMIIIFQFKVKKFCSQLVKLEDFSRQHQRHWQCRLMYECSFVNALFHFVFQVPTAFICHLICYQLLQTIFLHLSLSLFSPFLSISQIAIKSKFFYQLMILLDLLIYICNLHTDSYGYLQILLFILRYALNLNEVVLLYKFSMLNLCTTNRNELLELLGVKHRDNPYFLLKRYIIKYYIQQYESCRIISIIQYDTIQMENRIDDTKSNQNKLELDSNNKSIQYLEKIINYSQNKGNLISKFTIKYIAQIISINKLQKWSEIFSLSSSQNQNNKTNPIINNKNSPNQNKCLINLQQFVALFVSQIPHNKNQTLFLIMSLIDLFSDILNKSKFSSSLANQEPNFRRESIQYSLITDYLCQKITKNEQNIKVPLRTIPAIDEYNYNQTLKGNNKSPCIKYLFNQTIPFISRQSLYKQKSLKSPVSKLIYSKKMNNIICLISYGKKVQIYDFQFKLKKSIQPFASTHSNFNKQFIIVSIAYSDLHGRIGCVLHNIGLIFWQVTDKFETEKFIEGVKADSIFYLKSKNVWGTIKSNTISIWNIHKQCQYYKFSIENCTQINCLQQINLNQSNMFQSKVILSVNFHSTKRELHMYNIKQQKALFLSKIQIDTFGCHTLHLNAATQTILQIGYNNKVKVWEYSKLTYELNIVGYLQGHRNIVMSVAQVSNTSIVLTADQKGCVKLWDLRYLRCFQTIRLSFKQIKQMLCINNCLIFGDNRINLTLIDYKKQQKTPITYIKSVLDEKSQYLYIFTTNSCYLIDKNTGEIAQIYLICDIDQQLICVQKMRDYFFMGTNKGNIIILDSQFKKRKSVKAHQGSIFGLWTDLKYNLVISISNDQSMIIWGFDYVNCIIDMRKSITSIPLNQLQQNGFTIQIQISRSDYLIGLTVFGKYIYLIDLDAIKLCQKLIFTSSIIAFKFHPRYPIIIVALQNKQILIIYYQKEKSKVKINSAYEIVLFQIFNYTQNQNNNSLKGQIQSDDNMLINEIQVGKNGQLILVINKNTIQLCQLQSILKQIGVQKYKKRKTNSFQSNFFRSIHEKFDQLNSQSEIKQAQNQINKVCKKYKKLYMSRIKSRNIMENCNMNKEQIVKFQYNKQLSTFSLLCSNAVFMLIDLNTLQCKCLRKQNNTFAQIWSKISENNNKLKDKIVKAINLNEKILKTKFRDQINQLINFDKLDICQFLKLLVTNELDSVQKTKVEKQVKLSNKAENKHRRYHSLLQFKNNKLSLKQMQTQKRVHKINIEQDKVKNQLLKPKRFVQLYKQKSKQNVLQDKFFRVSAQCRLIEQKDEKVEDRCQLYDRITLKYEKWKKDKSRSLSSMSMNINHNQLKTIKYIDPKPRQYQLKNNMKQKIQRMYYKKDKRSQLIKKILNKQCDEIYRKHQPNNQLT